MSVQRVRTSTREPGRGSAPAGGDAAGAETVQRMQLRYGFNEIDGWAAFSMGEHRDVIRRRLRLMGTQVMRLFVFDKPVPDPFGQWRWFAAVVQAVDSRLDKIREARMKGYEGDACGECGNFTLVRNGTCMKCTTCGSTSGCS